jgi:hypothetical protein
LKNNIEDPRNTVLIVGWQAPNTLGRRLVERQPVVRIFGMEHQLEAEVVTLNGFSGHADQPVLLDWVKALEKPPEQILWCMASLRPPRSLPPGCGDGLPPGDHPRPCIRALRSKVAIPERGAKWSGPESPWTEYLSA